MNVRVSSGKWLVGLSLLALIAIAVARSLAIDAAPKQSLAAVQSNFHRGEWPFTPPVRPAVPKVANGEWPANPIDRFVLSRLENAGLRPSPEADKAVLLRRVTYDLVGLPPKTAELDAFLADELDQAYLRVVDRLLASPRFGERWAQHWLDLVRYAETEGFKTDGLRENAFHYRDYVIDSFNSDRPFDEFIRQQLAGDEIEPNNPQALIATGFLRLYPDEDNAANLYQRRQEILDDVTDTTSLVFLGITMGCAQCHDHKFDDIPQTDYYRLQAFFASFAERDDLPVVHPAAVAAYHKKLARWEQATAHLRSEIDAMVQPVRDKQITYYLGKYEPAILASYRKPATVRTPMEEQIARMVQWRLVRKFGEEDPVKKLSAEEQKKVARLKEQLAAFNSLKPEKLPTAMAVEDVSSTAPPTHLLAAGNWKRPEAVVDPGFPAFLGAAKPETVALASVHQQKPTTGRRTQLAWWLTRPDHPLTARVIVNRLWQQHFGRGIVATPNDFGMQGERPTHPELLDWLAVELVENGWSLKHIHRLMVTSTAYRMTSLVNLGGANEKKAMEVDRVNTLLWRANRRRLEGEAIRDAMLQTSGELNLKMHGRSCRPSLPADVSARYAWEPDKDPAERNRRSVYVLAKRNMRYPLFEAFDQPDLHQSCPRRAVTVTAPQSLAMLNSELTLELARHWAERLIAEHSASTKDLVRAAYRAAYSREASDAQIKLAEAFFVDQARLVSAEAGSTPTVEVVADFCHALFNSNEFITVD